MHLLLLLLLLLLHSCCLAPEAGCLQAHPSAAAVGAVRQVLVELFDQAGHPCCLVQYLLLCRCQRLHCLQLLLLLGLLLLQGLLLGTASG
jgi:hypothetical protein